MHELGITQAILETVAQASEGRKVSRVVVEIGKLSLVLPDAIRFCFDLCSEGTPAEGALLEILETPGRARCRACETEMLFEQPYGVCRCGSQDLDWLSGEELVVKELEVV